MMDGLSLDINMDEMARVPAATVNPNTTTKAIATPNMKTMTTAIIATVTATTDLTPWMGMPRRPGDLKTLYRQR